MSQSSANDTGNVKEAKLPRRDWVLLPLLGLLTISLMAVSVNLIAHRTFTLPLSEGNCYGSDPETGSRAIPNSVCLGGVPESPLVEYKYNSCGDRAGVECGPKSGGKYRIVMTGTSIAEGGGVQQEKTFAALLPAEVFSLRGRRIELYNKGHYPLVPRHLAVGMRDVLAANPDMILWILYPVDIERELPDTGLNNPPDHQKGFLARNWFSIKATFASKPIPDAVNEVRQNELHNLTRTAPATLLLHYLYESRSQYLKNFLAAGDPAGFLQVQPSAKWQSRLVHFESDAAEIERHAKSAGVPLVVTLVPDRAQAAMISMGEWPAGFDPYKLDHELRSIIERDGGTYVDILPDYRTATAPEQGYYPVDGHPNADGHALIAKFLAKELTDSAIPALRGTAQQQAGLEPKK